MERRYQKQYVDDVMNGVVAIKPKTTLAGGEIIGEDPREVVKVKAKGITIKQGNVDGQYVVVVLPTDTATGDDKALLIAQHVWLTTLGRERVDLNGDAGPMEIQVHHKQVARWLLDVETSFE